jgi:acetylornithine/N-succinyldiaminopimelate aminotransferase
MTTAAWQARWDAALMGNYGTPPVVLVRGEGATVWDVDGKDYVDLFAGLAVNVLGHAHPAVLAASCRPSGTSATSPSTSPLSCWPSGSRS